MMQWIAATMTALLEWLAVAFCCTLAGALVIMTVVLIVMLQVEQYKEERRSKRA